MIPRNAKRLERTLLSARQALPRPARLYSTPSKSLNSPASATATIPTPNGDFLPFLPQNASQDSSSQSLHQFLSAQRPLDVLPTPEPDIKRSSAPPSERWFLDSRLLEMTSIIDACLHNFHDVERAREVFKRLREKVGSSVVQTSLYNRFLETYLGMAVKDQDQKQKQYWVEEAWKLYDIMETEAEEIKPNQLTYTSMLMFCQKFPPTEEQLRTTNRKTDSLLSNIIKRKFSVLSVIGSPTLDNPEDVKALAQSLALSAVKMNLTDVLNDLGHVPTDTKPSEDSSIAANFPPVRPVLKNSEVPFNISDLRRHLGQFSESRELLQNEAYARQQQLETSVHEMARDNFEHRKDMLEAKGIDDFVVKDDRMKQWMWDWHVRLRERLEADHAKLERGERVLSKTDKDVEPYLLMVKPETLSILTILETLRLHGTGGVIEGMKTARACITIGKAIENQHKMEVCKRNDIILSPNVNSRNMFSSVGYQELYRRRTAAAQTASENEGWTAAWSQTLRAKVGSVLLDRLLSVAEVTVEQYDPQTNSTLMESHPAFYQSYEYIRGQKLGVIKIHPAVVERMAKDSVRQVIHPRHLPMLVKPQPWVDYDRGGYLYSRNVAMRFKECHEQETYLKAATDKGHLEIIFAGLDILGSTPWRINQELFEVVIKVWNMGERMGKIPPAKYEIPEPVQTEEELKDLQTRSHHILRHRAWAQANANNHSERCSVNYKMEIARAFLLDKFYLPHNLDFRGRAYPIPPHLNHMGDDLSRSLLVFADAKPLGERGLRWLKIHAANLYGYDKAKFDDRVTWVDEHMQEIRDSAESPLEGSGWWRKADDPWQFLSACLELKKAFDLEDPTKYECALPVHQDGTCNGLQHYAALGGDAKGAEQVNLAAADKPSDVYTFISLQVQAEIDRDAETGHEIAIMLKDKITRKVVKQTVMTTVYGVTFIGAREQIEKQLREKSGVPKEMTWVAASYIAKKLLSTIGDTFKGAKGIQDWLNLCARLISKSMPGSRLGLREDEDANANANANGSNGNGRNNMLLANIKPGDIKKEQMTSVIWTTVLGLPIVQPYRKVKKRQVKTALQSVFIADPRRSAEVNTQKQASAFPPNFIHSLDATHMLLTAIECHKRGLTFASIHDSYWTHAADIDTMAEAIRETFIELHQSDILIKLEKEFRTRYADHYILINDLAAGGKMGHGVDKLYKSGVRLYVPKENAGYLKMIPVIGKLVEASEDESKWAVLARRKRSWFVRHVGGGVVASGEGQNEGEGEAEAEAAAAEEELEEELDEEEEDGVDMKRPHFVRLIDLLPPLPEKGNFEVSAIKASPYFFS